MHRNVLPGGAPTATGMYAAIITGMTSSAESCAACWLSEMNCCRLSLIVKPAMVSPMITRWTYAEGANQYHTGGVGVLNIEIAPEPHEWMMLGAGFSMLVLLYRANRRSR